MGTVDYMAPEQGEGKPVGPRTDLYSLGSVMYALMAGRPPFVGKTVAEVIHKVRFETPVPVGRLANDVPLELEQLIEQLLEKDPQKRVPTALAVSHRLKAMEHALSIRPVPGDPMLEPAADSPDSLLVDQATAELTARHLSGEPGARVTITTDDPLTDKSEATHFTRVGHDSEPAVTLALVGRTAARGPGPGRRLGGLAAGAPMDGAAHGRTALRPDHQPE